ncbi:MAG: hypothetical protein BroJett026_24230 [Betaproteobacteria bacterium]|nr:MAG: hypothetical protein BroJett026_24230 [Betaproteobacteria bacterium]
MNARLRRLLTLLVAFLMSMNALGASIAQLSPSACCRERGPSAVTADMPSAPCHAAALAAEACDHGGAGPWERSDAGGPGCGDQCVRCVAFHASSPAFIVTAAGSQTAVPTSYEIPVLHQGALPALRAERLDRPPAAVPLN